MQENTHYGRRDGVVLLRHECGDDARQHIAATGRRHAGIARGVDVDLSLRRADGGIGALEDNADGVLDGGHGRLVQACVAVGALAE